MHDTLVEIWKPWNYETHRTWFNSLKYIYAMNNTIIWGHHGLFMYIDGGYYGSSHDMNILWHFLIY